MQRLAALILVAACSSGGGDKPGETPRPEQIGVINRGGDEPDYDAMLAAVKQAAGG